MVLPTLDSQRVLRLLIELKNEVMIKRDGVLHGIGSAIGIAEVKPAVPVYGDVVIADLPQGAEVQMR